MARCEKLQRPCRCAAGSLWAHLRQIAREIRHGRFRGARGARTALRVLAALQLRIAGASKDADLVGDAAAILGRLGIQVSDRAARESVRILASLTVIVIAGTRHIPARIRLASTWNAARGRAEHAEVTPTLYVPGSDLRIRGDQLSLPWPAAPRIREIQRDSSFAGSIDERAPGECLGIRTHHEFLRDLPRTSRIQDAAQLLLDFGPAPIRTLLAAAGRRADHRTVAALSRAWAWLKNRGHLDAPVVPHPASVLLGIKTAATADPPAPRVVDCLLRHGVPAPWALGRQQARAVMGALHYRRRLPEGGLAEPLSLAELRKAALGSARATRNEAQVLAEMRSQPAGARHLRVIRTLDRGSFSALVRNSRLHESLIEKSLRVLGCVGVSRTGEHSKPSICAPVTRVYRLVTRSARCDIAATSAGSARVSGDPRRDRERGRPAGADRGRAPIQAHVLVQAGRRLDMDPSVPPPGHRRADRPAGGPRILDQCPEHPADAGRRARSIDPPPTKS